MLKIKTDKTKVYPFLYRGDGIRTHGGIAPTQPFQDCTLNLSDTPLWVYWFINHIILEQFLIANSNFILYLDDSIFNQYVILVCVMKSQRLERNSMAKIIKVGSQNLTPKIANPFKTSRNSTTNPFKYSNFEGNTLQFADVFEGFEPKHTNKLKMIASSVAGSMNKMRSSIAEPIINFVNRVRSSVSNAWEYAKNTNVSDLAGIKNITEAVNGLGNNISNRMSALNENVSALGKGISSKMGFLNRDVMDLGKEMAAKWSALVKQHSHHIDPETTSVAEIEQMWKDEIALLGGAA